MSFSFKSNTPRDNKNLTKFVFPSLQAFCNNEEYRTFTVASNISREIRYFNISMFPEE